MTCQARQARRLLDRERRRLRAELPNLLLPPPSAGEVSTHRVLSRENGFVVSLSRWSPQSWTPIRDRGGAYSLMTVLRGHVQDEQFLFDDGELVTKLLRQRRSPGVLAFGPRTLHRLRSLGNDAVTLQVEWGGEDYTSLVLPEARLTLLVERGNEPPFEPTGQLLGAYSW